MNINLMEQSLHLVYQTSTGKTSKVNKSDKTAEYDAEKSGVSSSENVSKEQKQTDTKKMSFYECLKAGYSKSECSNIDLSGDVTFSRQTTDFYFPDVDMSKPVSEMSMEEYKKYILNRIGQIPVTPFTYNNVLGPVTIQDDCFEHMKKDPQYEKLVMDTMHMELTADFGGTGCKCIGTYVFGATEDKIEGYAYGIEDDSTRKKQNEAIQKELERKKKLKKKKEEEAIEKMLLERRIIRQKIENGEDISGVNVNLSSLAEELLSFL